MPREGGHRGEYSFHLFFLYKVSSLNKNKKPFALIETNIFAKDLSFKEKFLMFWSVSMLLTKYYKIDIIKHYFIKAKKVYIRIVVFLMQYSDKVK